MTDRPKRIHRSPVRLYMETAELIVEPFAPGDPPTRHRIVLEYRGEVVPITAEHDSPDAALVDAAGSIRESYTRGEARALLGTWARISQDIDTLFRRDGHVLDHLGYALTQHWHNGKGSLPAQVGLDRTFPARLERRATNLDEEPAPPRPLPGTVISIP